MCIATIILASTLVTTAAVTTTSPLDILERDLQGIMTPFLGSQHGSFYLGGQSAPQFTPLTTLWPIRENETIGFTHPYFRDGRARGASITCDPITGCGHSLRDWEFYRNTRVLYGNVSVTDATKGTTTTVYVNPSPTTLLWRPDRLTIRYELEEDVVITEVKFFTNDDVMLNILTLDDTKKTVSLTLEGQSYADTKPLPHAAKDPSFAKVPYPTPSSTVINATIELDAAFATTGSSGCTKCGAIRIDESGLAYGKPIDCSFAPFPEGIDCLAKEGRLMYDGMAVFVATSVPLSSQNVKLDRDIANRAIYNISVPLTAGTATPLVLGWVMGDDTTSTRARIAKYMTPAAAAAALAARTAEALDFLTTKVPQLHVTLDKSKVMVDQRVRKVAAAAAAKAATFNYTAGYTCTTGNYLFLRDQTEATCEKACAADVNCVEFKLKLTSPNWCTLSNSSQGSPPKVNPDYGCGCKGACPTAPAPTPGPPSPIPPMNRTLDFDEAYLFGWAMYWMMLIDVQVDGTFETAGGHAQSAPNNFLGIHLHDSQYYVKVGAWVVPDEHHKYAHGNVMMWHNAYNSEMYQNGVNSQGKYGAYWNERFNKGLMPDNMGQKWIASSTCDEVLSSVEGAWVIFAKGKNHTFLATAYDLYHNIMVNGTIIPSDSHNQRIAYTAPKHITALAAMVKMATALGKTADAADWLTLYNQSATFYGTKWGRSCKDKPYMQHSYECDDSIVSYASALVPAPYVEDANIALQTTTYLMNDVTGHFPPNASYGAILLAKSLRDSTPESGPWIAHTTYTYEAIDGLFRHDVHDDAVTLATGHIRDMQRSYGFTIFPEAWSAKGGPWGDQWYNWGSCASINLVLDRLCGVDYSTAERATGATSDGILTIRDALPEDWAKAEVSIPMAGGVNVEITITRLSATSKKITVVNNPLGALAIQPWIGKQYNVTSAIPSGSILEAAGNRLDWLFVGNDAKAQTVIVVWE